MASRIVSFIIQNIFITLQPVLKPFTIIDLSQRSTTRALWQLKSCQLMYRCTRNCTRNGLRQVNDRCCLTRSRQNPSIVVRSVTVRCADVQFCIVNVFLQQQQQQPLLHITQSSSSGRELQTSIKARTVISFDARVAGSEICTTSIGLLVFT